MLTIIFLTYQRTEYALRTIESLQENLICSTPIGWYVADDGSDDKHLTAVLDKIDSLDGVIVGHHSERLGYGAGANKAWGISREYGQVSLWMEDDWELREPWDIQPYIELLKNDNGIGMIRLGHLPIELELTSIGRNGRMYLNVKKSRSYAFSGNPHLKHCRMHQVYGNYPTNKNPGDTEVAYDAQIRSINGSSIVWPLAIGDTFPFAHIGEVQSYG